MTFETISTEKDENLVSSSFYRIYMAVVHIDRKFAWP